MTLIEQLLPESQQIGQIWHNSKSSQVAKADQICPIDTNRSGVVWEAVGWPDLQWSWICIISG